MINRHPAALALTSLLTWTSLAAQSDWQPVVVAGDPAPSSNTVGAGRDSATDRLYLCGRLFTGSALDVWNYDGAQWNLEPVTFGTPPFDALDSAWDSDRNCMVLLTAGGTYEWFPGGVWLHHASTPVPLTTGAMCYDAGRGRTLSFGGADPTQADVYLDTLWSWDGQAWTLENPGATKPLPRGWAAMAYDPLEDSIVLHGGWVTFLDPFACPSCDPTIVVHRNDTWEWDGAVWTPAAGGPSLKAHAMVWDAARERMLMFGGSGGTQFEGDTYERVDGAWQLLSFTNPPGPRNEACLVFDPVRRGVYMTGGYHNRDSWLFATPYPADQEVVGAGCGGAGGAPEIVGVTLPYVDGDWTLGLGNLPGGATQAFLGLGGALSPGPADLTSIGMPGCVLFGDLALITVALPIVNGAAEFSIRIGNDPTLQGIALTTQGLVPDASANPLGLAVTAGLGSVIGLR